MPLKGKVGQQRWNLLALSLVKGVRLCARGHLKGNSWNERKWEGIKTCRQMGGRSRRQTQLLERQGHVAGSIGRKVHRSLVPTGLGLELRNRGLQADHAVSEDTWLGSQHSFAPPAGVLAVVGPCKTTGEVIIIKAAGGELGK